MTALTTNTPQRLVLAPGRLYYNNNVLAGITEGPITVELEQVVRQVSAEGVTQAVAGLEYPVSKVLRISAAIKELHDANLTALANHQVSPVGTAPALSWNRPGNYALLATARYLTNVFVLSPAADGTVVGYFMDTGLVTSAVMNTPTAPGESSLQITIESRASLATPNGETFALVRRATWPT